MVGVDVFLLFEKIRPFFRVANSGEDLEPLSQVSSVQDLYQQYVPF